jgi:hypothetical protein
VESAVEGDVVNQSDNLPDTKNAKEKEPLEGEEYTERATLNEATDGDYTGEAANA